jgi:hypothetical protein
VGSRKMPPITASNSLSASGRCSSSAAGRRLADDASRKEIGHALAEVMNDFTRRWLGKEKTVRVTRRAPSAGLCSRHGPTISP